MSRPATKVPPNLPADATAMMATQIPQWAQLDSKPTSVRIPVKAKNAGSSASTGNAVTESDTPRKSAKTVNDTLVDESSENVK